jgi:integrase
MPAPEPARCAARQLRTLTKPGLYSDGGNLYLQVRGPTQRSWLFHYMIAGTARSMGLGHVDNVSLVEARNKADAARRLVREGVDPREQRDAVRAAAITAKARAVTFSEVADRYIAAHEAGWRSAKHRAEWRTSLASYVEPMLGSVPVEKIDTQMVLKVLEPIWHTKTETASRTRGRIEMVLSYATARGWRDGPNPAVWRGHLQLMLPRRSKVSPVVHYPALDWREAPAFMAQLRARDGIGAKALQFTILTAVRNREARCATWDEIDLLAAVWSIPAARMKAGKPHRVPLSQPALPILQSMEPLRTASGPVFPGRSLKAPVGNTSLGHVLQSMGCSDITVHGFRSSFRDWCGDTGRPADIAEAALAHTLGNQTQVAYQRGDLLDRRRHLMDQWADYLGQSASEVVQFPGQRQARA